MCWCSSIHCMTGKCEQNRIYIQSNIVTFFLPYLIDWHFPQTRVEIRNQNQNFSTTFSLINRWLYQTDFIIDLIYSLPSPCVVYVCSLHCACSILLALSFHQRLVLLLCRWSQRITDKTKWGIPAAYGGILAAFWRHSVGIWRHFGGISAAFRRNFGGIPASWIIWNNEESI